MAVLKSQNGWAANDASLCATYTVPGSLVKLRLRRGDVATVLLYVAQRFDDEVEDIDTAKTFIEDAAPSIKGGEPSILRDDWSYAERPVRGSNVTLSNHASGTAIDLNATQHPRGVKGTFTATQKSRVTRILAALVDPATGRKVVRWGENYQVAPVDGMHFEIDADAAAVERVAMRIRQKQADEARAQEAAAAQEATMFLIDLTDDDRWYLATHVGCRHIAKGSTLTRLRKQLPTKQMTTAAMEEFDAALKAVV